VSCVAKHTRGAFLYDLGRELQKLLATSLLKYELRAIGGDNRAMFKNGPGAASISTASCSTSLPSARKSLKTWAPLLGQTLHPRGRGVGGLPVQAPTRYELVLDLKTAKALSMDVLPMLLARAYEVIE
jgi:hypothetical protein